MTRTATPPSTLGSEAALLCRVHHELKTPLFSIITAAHMLPDADEAECRRLAFILESSSSRLKDVIDDLLLFAELSLEEREAAPEAVDLGDLLRSLVRSRLRQADEAGVELDLDLPGGLPAAWADPALLRAAAAHLVDNALKFNRAGGRACVTAFVNEGELEFQVANTGDIIPREQAARAFQSFQQLEDPLTRRFRGLGLGLSIVRKAVESMGGAVLARSSDGWNVFAVRLPLRA